MVATLAVFAAFACGGRAVVDQPTAEPGTSDGSGETSTRVGAEPAGEFTVGGVWRDGPDYGVRSWVGPDAATEAPTGGPDRVEAADSGAPVEAAPAGNRVTAGTVGGGGSATEFQPPRPPTPMVPAPPSSEAPDPTPPGEAAPRAVGILGQAKAAIVSAEVSGLIGQGAAQALTAKVDSALAGLDNHGPVTRSCGPLVALVNLVNAQYGTAVPPALADGLLSAARSASRALACP